MISERRKGRVSKAGEIGSGTCPNLDVLYNWLASFLTLSGCPRVVVPAAT
jgi:hypothetical protein